MVGVVWSGVRRLGNASGRNRVTRLADPAPLLSWCCRRQARDHLLDGADPPPTRRGAVCRSWPARGTRVSIAGWQIEASKLACCRPRRAGAQTNGASLPPTTRHTSSPLPATHRTQSPQPLASCLPKIAGRHQPVAAAPGSQPCCLPHPSRPAPHWRRFRAAPPQQHRHPPHRSSASPTERPLSAIRSRPPATRRPKALLERPHTRYLCRPCLRRSHLQLGIQRARRNKKSNRHFAASTSLRRTRCCSKKSQKSAMLGAMPNSDPRACVSLKTNNLCSTGL